MGFSLAKMGSLSTITRILLSTDDRELVKGNWWNDKFWGVCNGEGKTIWVKCI